MAGDARTITIFSKEGLRGLVLVVLLLCLALGGCSRKRKKLSMLPEETLYGQVAPTGNTRVPYQNPRINIPRVVPPGGADRYSRVDTNQPILALTFDDGPHPSNTPRLLDILNSRNVKATFYVVGSNVQRYPQLVARMVREGHEVANHSWNHPSFTKISDGEVRSELQRTAQAIYKASGIYPRTCRPPYGAITRRHQEWIYREFGYPTIMWDVDPNDWKKPGSSVVASRLVSGARKGSILLAHDIHSGTISAIPSVLDQLLARNYRFVTVTQLIHASQMMGDAGSPDPPAQAAVVAKSSSL